MNIFLDKSLVIRYNGSIPSERGTKMIKEMHDFIESKLLDENKSEITMGNYSRQLTEFCDITGVKTFDDFLALRQQDLQKYIRALNLINQSSSVWTKAMAVRSFYGYMVDNGFCQENLMAKVKLPKKTVKEVKPPTKSNVIDILIELKKNKTYYTLMTLISSTGLRISEALAIKITDVYENQIKVLGKGDKERTVFLSVDTMEIIKDYIKTGRHEKPLLSKEEFDGKGWTKFKSYNSYSTQIIEGHELLFISKTGIKMDTKSVRETLKKYATKAGVDMTKVQVSPHKLRSSFATNGMMDGVPIAAMRDMLGHSDVKTTMRYFGLNQEQKQEAFQLTFDFGKELNARS